ncbi:hypothetical protein [Jannaschia sp. W003]|uniref:hypothetical protein n=1 Tax=Jannaschia sp. W003 TaxID=2867012 RepID=UPI0021A465B8|nr:hypothetical protein [Jannaschia sp. W003]UWQ20825.1 hypothetical protein K3554_12705 [Jannaschia sp. W003]
MRSAALIVLLGALPAAADGVVPAATGVDCYCTDSAGERVEMGETACLTVGDRSFLALCDMSLNVPIWRDTEHGCVSG